MGAFPLVSLDVGAVQAVCRSQQPMGGGPNYLRWPRPVRRGDRSRSFRLKGRRISAPAVAFLAATPLVASVLVRHKAADPRVCRLVLVLPSEFPILPVGLLTPLAVSDYRARLNPGCLDRQPERCLAEPFHKAAMSRLGVAFRSFFAALGDATTAERIDRSLRSEDSALEQTTAIEAPQPPHRSEAVTLLAALQREARLLDFLMEPIESFSDEQVGAAVRDVHRGCRATLDRLLPVAPVVNEPDGSTIDSAALPAGTVRVIGGDATVGTLVHPGWQLTDSRLPEWSGSEPEAAVIMPAEIEA